VSYCMAAAPLACEHAPREADSQQG